MPQRQDKVENLFLLTSNRKQSSVFFLSSNMLSLVSAKECGFCVIPINLFQQIDDAEIDLYLVEKYLLKLRYASDQQYKNQTDFGFLVERNNQKPSTMQSLSSESGASR